MKKTLWIGAILGLVAWGCGDMISNPISGEFGLRMDDSGATAAGISEVVRANNRFALDVYSELKGDEGNLFLSPYSISTALAMTHEGARGQTAEEIARVFHFPTDDPGRRAAFAALHNRLNEAAADYTLRVANALWAQKDYRFLEAYLNVLQSYYAAKATNVDFSGATETARQTINTWVEERTERKIKDLFPQGTIDSDTRLALTNAIYFKGQWVTQFDKRQTKNEAFHVSPDRSVNVPMMRLTGEGVEFKYIQDEDVQVLEMPYKGAKVSMLVLLPRSGGLAAFENGLTPEKLEGWRAGLRRQRVDAFLPKFTFETKYFMNKVLQKMGMPTAFSGGADFSGMTGTRDLAIQHVIHQAFVDVNEEGTEAAAATGVSVGRTSVPQVAVFRADRPFLFAIQDTERGNLLFLGRVVNPAVGSATRS